jgi:hypothetical protein
LPGDVPADLSAKRFWCLVTAAAQVLHRLVTPYHQYPYRIAKLVDSSLSHTDRLHEANLFHNRNNCCLDPHFSIPLKSKASTGSQLITEERLTKSITLAFMTKNINIEVETNFARAANQRGSQRGRAQSTASAAAKHVVSEIALSHRRWGLVNSIKEHSDCTPVKRKLGSDCPSCLVCLTYVVTQSAIVIVIVLFQQCSDAAI